MSTESGRKDLSTKIVEGMTPDTSKSTGDKITQSTTGHADHLTRDIQPDSTKSVGQSAHDHASRMTDTSDHSKSVGDKIKDAIPGMHSDKHSSDTANALDPTSTTTTTEVINKNL